MAINKKIRRPIGRILLDGGFLPPHHLEAALEKQKHTNELLGQALVKMGVLDPTDIKAALSVQAHLDRLEDAVKIAAGDRQMLGGLLVQAGRITSVQLEQAIGEQERSGEKIGEVLVRQGLLTERELNGILDFQKNQSSATPSSGPLRLGEILITTGSISREQLDDALRKQTQSRKKLGEVLIEEGYAKPHHVRHGIRLQHMLMTAVLIAILTACGGGGGNMTTTAAPAPVSTTTSEKQVTADYFTVTNDEYGLLKPNFYYSTNNASFWSIEADVAQDLYDPDFQCVIRIDIPKQASGVLPDLNKTFSIEENPQYETFPGTFSVFNGQKSVYKRVEQGTITFSPDSSASGNVTGTFDVILTDYDSNAVPAPQYHIKGEFGFKMGTYTYAPTAPLSAEQLPVAGSGTYE